MLKPGGLSLGFGVVAVALGVMMTGDGWEPFGREAYGMKWGLGRDIGITADRAVAAGDDLWIMSGNGKLWRINEPTATAEDASLEDNVLDVCVSGDIVRLISAPTDRLSEWTMRTREDGAWRPGPTFNSGGAGLVTMICGEGGATVVTSRDLLGLTPTGVTRRLRLSHRIPSAMSNTVIEQGQQLLIGANWGHYGGGLYRLDRGTGEVTVVEGEPGEPCERLLDDGCSPILGMVPIPWKSQCTAVLVGGGGYSVERNAVLELCGSEVKSLFRADCGTDLAPKGDPRTMLPCMSRGLAAVDGRLLLMGTHAPVWQTAERESGAGRQPAFRSFGPYRIAFERDVILIDRLNNREEIPDLLVVPRPRKETGATT